MGVNEQVMSIGDWSVTLRPDTPQSVREAVAVDYSQANPVGGAFGHIVITPAWVDVTNAGLSDAAILSAARYTGVCLRPGPQLRLSGAGLAWWMGDADDNPRYTWSAVSGQTWADAYGFTHGGRLLDGSYASGGSFTISDQTNVSRRNRLDTIAQVAGHEWRINPDLTLDGGTVADLYGTAPSVVLVDGGTARGGALVGLDATFDVEEDWEQWTNDLSIITPAGITGAVGNVVYISPSAYATGGHPSKGVWLDVPDVPQGFEQDVADDLQNQLSQPRYEVTVQVRDRGLVDHVRPGDLLYVYDELKGLRDLDNQVVHQGRTIWPKIMRATRMSWPVRQGMGVYFRNLEPGGGTPTYVDLTPYVEWEDGDAQVDIIDGDAAKYTLNPATGRVDQVGAAIERAWAQPWVTYTPTWTSTDTQPVVNNGTLVGAYRRHGTTLHLRGELRAGSTTTFGTGSYLFALPPGVTSAAAQDQHFAAQVTDFGTARRRAVAWLGAAATSFSIQADDSANALGATAPFTMANQDRVAWGGTIEIAP